MPLQQLLPQKRIAGYTSMFPAAAAVQLAAQLGQKEALVVVVVVDRPTTPAVKAASVLALAVAPIVLPSPVALVVVVVVAAWPVVVQAAPLMSLSNSWRLKCASKSSTAQP